MEEYLYCIEGSERYFPGKVYRISFGEPGEYERRELTLSYDNPDYGLGEIGSLDFTVETREIPTKKTKKGNPSGWKLKNTFSLIAIEIRPEHRRKGHGKKLVKKAENIAKQRNMETVFAYRTNAHSSKMMKKMGYEQVDSCSRDMFKNLR